MPCVNPDFESFDYFVLVNQHLRPQVRNKSGGGQ